MAEISTTQSFADGDTVTAAKLNNILGNSSISSEIITNRSELTVVDGASDFILGYDTSASSLRKIKPNNIVADSSISTNKIANLAVTTGKINDLAVTTGKINDLAVTTGKIADSAITTSKITDSNITTAKIADANITTAKIADASVTNDKISVLSPNPEGTYGGSTSIPTIVVNSRGRVTSVSNNSISAGGLLGLQFFTSSDTFTVPTNVSKIKVTCIGGGGGTGGNRTGANANSGGAGGSGGVAVKLLNVSGGQQWAVTIGAGGSTGSASSSPTSGSSGGQTSFVNGATTIAASGGGGGGTVSTAGATGASGASGSGSGGDINLTSFGNRVALGWGEGTVGYGGSSSAGSMTNGVAGAVLVEW